MRTTRRWKLIGIKDMKCNTMDIFDSVKGGGGGKGRKKDLE